MKLGVKIFCCISVFFSVAFLLGGYTLLSYFYETSMEREVETVAEQYQYNKFVVQATLLAKGEAWFERVADGTYNAGMLVADMGNTVALCRMDGTILYSDFPKKTQMSGLLSDVKIDQINYQFLTVGERIYAVVAGILAERDTSIYLITGIEVGQVLEQQEKLLQKFGAVYMGAVAISIVLIFALSAWIASPIKRLAQAARSIAGGNYSQRIKLTGKDEVGQLALDFNQMAFAIEEKIQELSENARQKEEFSANFAHELKTPLTSIIGYSNRIYQKELSREEQKEAAFYIWNEGMRLESLSHKLMDLTNLNDNILMLQRVSADVLLKEFVKALSYLLEERHAAVDLYVEQAEISVEYDLFQSLFLNLIDNALKAGADKLQITGTIVKEERFFYIIQIQDNGTGIPQDELRKITEAFYMVDKSRSRKQHGAGLGLAIAEKIARLHSSSLHFESSPGEGTVVSIKLPCIMIY